MPRSRRDVSPEGMLTCTLCKEVKHISDFYCNRGVWFIQEDAEGNGTIYGKPNSWCKACQKKRNAERGRERTNEADVEWEKAVEAAAAQGYVLIKDPDGTVRGVPLDVWQDPEEVVLEKAWQAYLLDGGPEPSEPRP